MASQEPGTLDGPEKTFKADGLEWKHWLVGAAVGFCSGTALSLWLKDARFPLFLMGFLLGVGSSLAVGTRWQYDKRVIGTVVFVAFSVAFGLLAGIFGLLFTASGMFLAAFLGLLLGLISGVVGFFLLLRVLDAKFATCDHRDRSLIARGLWFLALILIAIADGYNSVFVILPPGRPDDLQSLVGKLDTPNECLKAVQALGAMGGEAKAAVPKLIPLLKENDPEVRRAAREALEKIGPPQKVDYEFVIDCLGDKDAKVRVYAAQTVGKMLEATPKTVKALTGAMKDAEVEVRHHAAMALGKLGTDYRDNVVPALLNALADPNSGVRREASEGLTKIGLDSKKDFHALKDVVLKHSVPEIRFVAIEILAKGEVNQAIAVIFLKALKDDNEAKIRNQAVKGLAKADRDAKQIAIPALLEDLHQQDKTIQAAALACLTAIGTPADSEMDRLVKCLKHANVDVRLYAVQSLLSLSGPRARGDIVTLSELLEDSDKKVSRLAAQALGKLSFDAKSVAPELQQVALNSSFSKISACAVAVEVARSRL
ncbi:MAG: HEAT repeat domain-containing protein, partial [Gemmataceae bacterium]|nr:HEAT repeat domain-containing protein [Gemmataceae bacterium]